jgi:hypothetical protein
MYWLLQPDGELHLKSAEGASVFLQGVERGFTDLDRQRQSCLFIVGLELNLTGSVNGPFVVTSRCRLLGFSNFSLSLHSYRHEEVRCL